MSAEMAAPRFRLAMRTDEDDTRSSSSELTMHVTHEKTQEEAEGS